MAFGDGVNGDAVSYVMAVILGAIWPFSLCGDTAAAVVVEKLKIVIYQLPTPLCQSTAKKGVWRQVVCWGWEASCRGKGAHRCPRPGTGPPGGGANGSPAGWLTPGPAGAGDWALGRGGGNGLGAMYGNEMGKIKK